jgi:hypothetical protein
MRLLTVPQPRLAVLTVPRPMGKPVIDRRFPVTARNLGPVVLVAGELDRTQLIDPFLASTLDDAGLTPDELPTGGIATARAILVDCHQAAGACCAPWGTSDRSFFHLVLDDVRPLATPVTLPLRPGLTRLDAKEHAKVLTAL